MKREPIRRCLIASRSLRTRAAGIIAVALSAAAISGCDRRMYPTHPLIVAVQQDAGALELSAGFNQCPVAGFDVSPTTAKVDQPFDVVGRASDPDGDGGVLTFAWTASSGSFDQATASQTVFRCGDPGPVTLTLTVSDGSCDTPTSASIFCLGTHQDGGADALGGPSGSGGAGGRGGSGGTPGAGGDNGSGAGGQPGSGGVSGTGGRGIVNGCPAAEPAGNASSDGGGSSACEQCTTDNCSLLSAPQGGTDGCCGLDSVTDQLLCEALVACYSNNGCTNAGDPTGCFCGNNPVTCFMFAGQANGPCVAPVVAAAKTSDPSEIKIQFTRPTSALGRATNLTSCRGSFCPAECGIN